VVLSIAAACLKTDARDPILRRCRGARWSPRVVTAPPWVSAWAPPPDG